MVQQRRDIAGTILAQTQNEQCHTKARSGHRMCSRHGIVKEGRSDNNLSLPANRFLLSCNLSNGRLPSSRRERDLPKPRASLALSDRASSSRTRVQIRARQVAVPVGWSFASCRAFENLESRIALIEDTSLDATRLKAVAVACRSVARRCWGSRNCQRGGASCT
jgi:hypothetical protein